MTPSLNDTSESTFTWPDVESLVAFISTGYAIPLDTAEHIVRRVLEMAMVERERVEHDEN